MRFSSKRVCGMRNKRKNSPAEVCGGEKVETSTPEAIPIPGVTEVSGYLEEQVTPFSMPEGYITLVGDEVSRALGRGQANYDMDDEDEAWLRKLNAEKGNICEECFELVIDAFEKTSFLSPGEVGQVPLPADLCSEDVARAVHCYWLNKRKRQKSALVRVFEVHKPKKARGRPRKKLKQVGEGQRRVTARTAVLVVGDECAAEEEEEIKLEAEAAVASAKRLGDLAIEKRRRAQVIMTKANLLMCKAGMAIRIAEEAQIRESLGISAGKNQL